MIALVIASIIQLYVAQLCVSKVAPTPAAIGTPAPSLAPRPTPRRISGPTSDPHRFTFEVRPVSVKGVDVFISGKHDLSTPPPPIGAVPTLSLTPAVRFNTSTPLPLPTPTLAPLPPPLNETNAKTAVQVTATTINGLLVAQGLPSDALSQRGTFEVLHFELDHPLPPSQSSYVITARWLAAPDLSTSSRLSIAAVPENAGTRISDEYIEASDDAPYYPATLFRLARSTGTREDRQRTFISVNKPRETFVGNGDDDNSGLGPAITDAAVDMLRRKYIGPPIKTTDYVFGCIDALNEGARAELLPGKAVQIDTIARAAHVMRWLPDNPRVPIYDYPCNSNCSKNDGVFVDSPLVVGFKVDSDSVRIIHPTTITRPYIFHGNCIRGFAVLQDERQFSDVFALAATTP